MKASIVLTVFNKWNFTKSCLEDLLRLKDVEIIVIDNNSSDETNEKIKDYNVVYHRNDENLFHSKACNIGYGLAKADNVLFLNNDIRVKSNHDNWIDILLEDCNKGIVGPTMGLLDNDLNFVKEANQFMSGNSYISGWCLASSKEIFNTFCKNGEVWLEKFPFYFNDTDLSFRARKNNIPLIVKEIPVVHFGQVSSKQLHVTKLYSEGRKVFYNKYKNQ